MKLREYHIYLIGKNPNEYITIIANKATHDFTKDGKRITVFIRNGEKVGIFFSDKIYGYTKEEIPKDSGTTTPCTTY